ncbi:MAG: cob(I)yrinic acid a,c-diamide adenosyltransferase [Cyanobacteria bacterium J06642_2]
MTLTQLEAPPVALPTLSPVVKGTLHLFINPHRSFFTPAIVQAMHSAGQGKPSLIVQLLKGGINQGPDHIVHLGDRLQWVRCGIERCVDSSHLEPEERLALDRLWDFTKQAIDSGDYGLVVLDELGLAIKLGLIPEAEVIDLLDNRPVSMDVAMTGPEMPESLMERADQITHLRHNNW